MIDATIVKEMGKRNFDLPDQIDRLLDEERDRGSLITSTMSAAVYWFFKVMDDASRAEARRLTQKWLEGEQAVKAASELDDAGKNAGKGQGGKPAKPRSA